MSNVATFTNEQQLAQRYPLEIAQFWRQGQFGHFAGVNGVRINYASFTWAESRAESRASLVIVPGRSEGYLKYKELSYDLYRQGYDVFILDHRGQGISGRMLASPFKGYVEEFDHYSDDLHTFIEQVVSKHCHTQPYLLAHSMGGAIAARYLQRHPEAIKAAVFCSPMIAINSAPIPHWLASGIILLGHKLNHTLSSQPWYFLGQGDFEMSSFADNHLMHSKLRYQLFVELYRTTKEIQLGGVTFHWLAQALANRQRIFEQLDRLKTPLLVLQAGNDTVVDNQAQTLFCRQLHKLQPASCPAPVVIQGAYHELLFEADHYRDQALTHALAWFNRH